MYRTSKTSSLLMAVGVALISLVTSVIAVGGAAATPVNVAAPGCSTGTAVSYRGAWYCPGTPLGVYDNAYGMGTRVVLKATIASTSGTTARVQVVIPCRASYCGALIKYDYITLYFAAAPPTPPARSVLTVYGVSTYRGLNVVGYVVTGTAPPDCGDFC